MRLFLIKRINFYIIIRNVENGAAFGGSRRVAFAGETKQVGISRERRRGREGDGRLIFQSSLTKLCAKTNLKTKINEIFTFVKICNP